MAVVNKTIGSGGSYDYTTIAAFEAAIPSNTTDQWIGTCQLDEVVNTGYLAFNVSNSNNMQHTVTVLDSVRHDFVSGAGARMTHNVSFAPAMDLRTNNITLQNIGMYSTQNSGLRIVSPATNVIINNCYVQTTGATTAAPIIVNSLAASGLCTIKKTTAVQNSTTSGVVLVNIASAGTTVAVENCSFLENDGTVSNWMIVTNGAGTMTCNNVKALGDNVNGSGRESFDSSITGDYNVGSDTSAPGANSTDNQDPDDHYTDTTSGSEVMTIKSTLDKSLFIGGNQVAGETDVEGAQYVSDYCDIGSQAASTAPSPSSGGGNVKQSGLNLRLGLGL